MAKTYSSLNHLSDDALLTVVKRLAHHEREATAQLIASLVELDSRRLYLGEGCSSLFTYCTQVLHLPKVPPTGESRPLALRGGFR